MTDLNRFRDIVWRAIDSVNEVLLDGNTLSKDGETVLLGEGARLDSMGFVNFVVALEDATAEALGRRINLSEEINSRSAQLPQTITVADVTAFLQARVQGT